MTSQSSWIVDRRTCLAVGLVGAAAPAALAQPCVRWDDGPAIPKVLGISRLTYDASRQVTVGMGFLPNPARLTLAEWDGHAWVERQAPGPLPRRYFAIAFDARASRVILHGGEWSGFFGDMWAWDGQQWEEIPAGASAARSRHSMAFDQHRGELVVFGGIGPGNQLLPPETWIFDGRAWRLAATTGPAARGLAAMAYDPINRRTVLFGGGHPDTWTWDGVRWEQLATLGPPSWNAPAMAFDPGLGGIAMKLNEVTWFLDGNAWRVINVGENPFAPIAAISYDDIRGELVAVTGATTHLGRAADPAFAAQPESTSAPQPQSISFFAKGCGQGPLAYQWRHNGLPLRDDGRIMGAQTNRLVIDPTMLMDTGHYSLEIMSPGGSAISMPVFARVYESEDCYPDCDQSTGVGVLDIFDFLCFNHMFLAGDEYACGCTNPGIGVCDIFDFLCFANAFHAGCP